MVTFDDIFTSAFLDRIGAVPLIDAIVAMLLACGIGLFIFLIYRKTSSAVMYSTSFGVTLVALTLITTLVILAVSSNVLLSLGMVGALSIVRFRAPIKEPLDLVFLFWCIATGIVLAAGLLFLAIFGAVFIGLVLLMFADRKTDDRPYMLVVHLEGEGAEQSVVTAIEARAERHALKAKNVHGGSVELTFELRLKEGGAALVDELDALEGVTDAVLVSYNGDYLG
ncbi:DUF4956 domain-containing protein [Enorma sp.]|uniref:DUF4956 domain-containing protein n=1 Tax=Enorma sp. TaxID=1920692 RepID=UPI0025C276F8|nr:DUF4956 domain-containing protein [Enorma sp.]